MPEQPSRATRHDAPPPSGTGLVPPAGAARVEPFELRFCGVRPARLGVSGLRQLADVFERHGAPKAAAELRLLAALRAVLALRRARGA